jgi:hypothetical protein
MNFDSCSNQLAYTTLFVGSLGYAASRLIAFRSDRRHQLGSTGLTAADHHSVDEQQNGNR